jgi:hypothetical protein
MTYFHSDPFNYKQNKMVVVVVVMVVVVMIINNPSSFSRCKHMLQ